MSRTIRRPEDAEQRASDGRKTTPKRKLQRAPQSVSAAQSQDPAAAARAAKKANAEQVAREMEAKRAEQRQQAEAAAGAAGYAANTPRQHGRNGQAGRQQNTAAGRVSNAHHPRTAADASHTSAQGQRRANSNGSATAQGQRRANANGGATAQGQRGTNPHSSATVQDTRKGKAASQKSSDAVRKKKQSQASRKDATQASKQTNKQAGRQTGKQTGRGKDHTNAAAQAREQTQRRVAQNPNHAPVYNIDADAAAHQTASPQPNAKQRPVLSKAAIRRRKFIRNTVATVFVLLLVGIGVIYSVDLLFRVKTIEIQTPDGETPADTGIYTEAVILAQLDIALDDHMFSFNTNEKVQILEEALPLLENIAVIRDYPDGVVVQVSPAIETYTMEIAGGWIVLSEQLHVMSVTAEQPNLLVLIGATPSSYVPGQTLSFVQEIEEAWYAEYEDVTEVELAVLVAEEMQARTEAQIAEMIDLIAALEEAELLSDITAIDFDGEDGISFWYQDRIAVLIGTTNSLDYKLSIAQYILWNKNGDGCAASDTGILDVSYQNTDGTITTTFAQGVVTFPLVSEVQTETTDEEELLKGEDAEEGEEAAEGAEDASADGSADADDSGADAETSEDNSAD